MSGRNRIFDEKEVIDKAIALFWTQGYEASSTDGLLAAMGIGKGSFYHAFPGGKQELFEKAMEQFNNKGISRLRKDLLAGAAPIARIRAFFLEIADGSKAEHERGCFFGNTIAELSVINTPLKNKAVKLLRQLEQLFYEALQSAQEQGALPAKEDPAVLARYLLNLWNGLNITRRMYPDAALLKPLIEMQLKILG
jgi:TetR/AcrR family transcriptional repressor of nem operon